MACSLSAQAQFFRTEGKEILDPEGNPVVLRGLGLGGWLMPEGYMLHVAAPDGGSPRTIRAQIEDLIGVSDTDRFFEIYRANYVEEKDVAAIADWGFDHIRLPFHYNLFFDGDTETFIEEGFALVDTFLEWCRTHGLYVILDMHAAPGAQNDGNISDSDGTARLWTEPDPYQDQTVAIWKEIARRYADEPLIIGYDLINEPVTPDGIDSSHLWALYRRIVEAVRQVDTNHIVFLEGNYYATTFTDPNEAPPVEDDNMVYAFHKYWNGIGTNSIQYLLDLREGHDVPLWLGETGENSNPWFHAVTRLMDEHRIGTNWWTHKKIETTTSPLSAPFAPGYEAVLDYWRGTASRPNSSTARKALFSMAEGLDMDSCVVRQGVLAALLDPDFASLRRPVGDHVIPGVINAVDYDLGNQGVTYNDSDVMATTGTPGGGNNGTRYRNDGVDIERSSDPEGFHYNVGWVARLEWLTYTVRISPPFHTGLFDIEIRVASGRAGGGRLHLLLDDERIGEEVVVPFTGDWQNWTSVWLRDLTLPPGEHILKLLIRSGEFNINRLRFTFHRVNHTESPDRASLEARYYPNPFSREVRVAFGTDRPAGARLEIVDMLGRKVFTHSWPMLAAGEHVLSVRPNLASGAYVSRLILEEEGGSRVPALEAPVVVVR